MHERYPLSEPLDFTTLEAELRQVSASVGAAEVHGIICALVCVPRGLESPEWLDEIVPSSAEAELSGEQVRRFLIDVAAVSRQQLHGDEFDFYPLLPADEFPIQSRSAALGEWCTGFLFGLSLAGAGDVDSLPADSREVVTDLSNFATIRGSSASEDEEAAYAELVEYVRVGVMLINQELSGGEPETDSNTVLH